MTSRQGSPLFTVQIVTIITVREDRYPKPLPRFHHNKTFAIHSLWQACTPPSKQAPSTYRRHGSAAVCDTALQELTDTADELGRIATPRLEQGNPNHCKMPSHSTHAPSHAELCWLERANSNGLHEHGRSINHRRGPRLPEPALRMFSPVP